MLPGDWVVADNDGVVVVPEAMAAEVAVGSLEQERHELFILEQVRAGAAIPGTYPPNEANLAAYEAWKKTSNDGMMKSG